MGERKVRGYFNELQDTWVRGQKGLVDALDGLDGNRRGLIAWYRV
jgi:hypothetical protein